MMRRLAFAAALLLVAGCGGEQAATDASPTATATTESPPPSRTIITEGVIDKRVGQPGGFGSGEGHDAVCDVTFTVTAIEQDPPCPGGSPPAGTRLLRIEVDAEASAAFQYEPPATALLLSHWILETDDGGLHRDLRVVDACSPHPGVFAGPLAPGSHPRDSVVVVAPAAPPSSGWSTSRRRGGGRCGHRFERRVPEPQTRTRFDPVSDLTNRQVVLRRRPTGLVGPGDTELVDGPVPELADGEALVRTTYIGVDAAVRTWLDDKPGYLPPVQIGEPIRAAGVGEVVATRCLAYAVGDVVTMLPGFESRIRIPESSTPRWLLRS